MTERLDPGASIYGNFPNYYSFNASDQRVKFIPRSLLGRSPPRSETAAKEEDHHLPVVVDVGCNAGNVSAQLLTHFDRPVRVVGCDLDANLVQRARETFGGNDGDEQQTRLRFEQVDMACQSDAVKFFRTAVDPFHREQLSETPPRRLPRVALSLVLSITMWVHIHHGDEGLLSFLARIASFSDMVLVEPQPRKAYKSCKRRLSRLGAQLPPHLNSIRLKDDISLRAAIDSTMAEKGLIHTYELGTTEWDRQLVLYSREVCEEALEAGAERKACLDSEW